MDPDLRSIQQARALLGASDRAQKAFKAFSQDAVDHIVEEMVAAGIANAEKLAGLAHEETGFGRIESKIQKNLFATRTLQERMREMKTCGIIRKYENDTVWEIATPMGVIAALVPSTNPTSTAMYKALISAKARCGIVISPHPRAVTSTAEALRIVAEAAYRAGAPDGLFGCMTEISLQGTNALLEDERTDLILATGGHAMVRAAYSKGKPAYGVGSGNVPVYVDRSAYLEKASKDILYGASFDYGTLCSTERSIVADLPIRTKLLDYLRANGGHILDDSEKNQLRNFIWSEGRLNVNQVGKSPAFIAQQSGFSVSPETKALVAEVDVVGKEEPLSMETLSPVLSFYTTDGWEAGCERCKEILAFGGIGHTLGLHCNSDHVVESFALEKPAMRIVVNTVCALGAVGYTNRLFPSLTLGPGTVGGSITSDNISPLHLLNIKRLAFETSPVNEVKPSRSRRSEPKQSAPPPTQKYRQSSPSPWMEEIDARLRARAGNPPDLRYRKGGETPDASEADQSQRATSHSAGSTSSPSSVTKSENPPGATPLSQKRIDELIQKFRK